MARLLEMSKNKKYQLALMALLMASACFLTYYFQKVLGIGTVFTHFFYIPIILACVWWERKGLAVSVFLTGILLFSHKLFDHYLLTLDDYLRALMLFVISLVIIALSERLSHVKNELQASEERYRTVFETTATAMAIVEEDTTISLVNSEFEKLSGFSRAEVEKQKSWTEFVIKEDLKRMIELHRVLRTDVSPTLKSCEFQFINRKKEVRDIFITIGMMLETRKRVASFADVTELKHALEEQKLLQQQLSEALAKVLSGFIPICANCKKIRDEQNDWVQIESFIKDRTRADFSHGICPDCAKALYPEFIIDELSKLDPKKV